MRAEKFISSKEPLARLLNLESEVADDERRAALAGLLTSEVLPFASTCLTRNGLRSLHKAGAFENCMLLAVARPILEEPVV